MRKDTSSSTFFIKLKTVWVWEGGYT